LALVAVVALPLAVNAGKDADTEADGASQQSPAMQAMQEAAAPEEATGEAATESEPTEAEATAQPAQLERSISRATFTTGILEREPRDMIETLGNDSRMVYYFTEAAGLEGTTLIHRWEYQGRVMAEVPIEIGGPRWRVYSTKNLEPGWTGEWQVSAVDESGTVLETTTFEYLKPAPAPEPAEEKSGTEVPAG
jgi:hypothetical protein